MRFPNLFGLAVRVFATPVSSCAIERLFSTVKIIIDEKRSGLTTSLVDYITVMLHKWFLHNFVLFKRKRVFSTNNPFFTTLSCRFFLNRNSNEKSRIVLLNS